MIKGVITPFEAAMVALSGFVIVFIMLALLWGVILVISRVISGQEKKAMPTVAAAAPTAPAAAPVPASAPQVVLQGIDETQAACVMAIVSHESGIPLDELVFKSIKAVKGGHDE